MKKVSIILSILLMSLMLASNALAHKVNIYAYEDNGSIHSETYFASGKRCTNCLIEVFEAGSNIILLKGRSDNKGMFVFPYTGDKSLKLITTAGAGHRGEFRFSSDVILDTENKNSSAIVSPIIFDHEHSDSAFDVQCIKLIEEKHNTEMREIAKLREAIERPGLTEILGGIGYIIGIFGFIMYIKSRKQAA